MPSYLRQQYCHYWPLVIRISGSTFEIIMQTIHPFVVKNKTKLTPMKNTNRDSQGKIREGEKIIEELRTMINETKRRIALSVVRIKEEK